MVTGLVWKCNRSISDLNPLHVFSDLETQGSTLNMIPEQHGETPHPAMVERWDSLHMPPKLWTVL